MIKYIKMFIIFWFTIVNIALFFFLNVRFYFLFYLAISNGIILGLIGSYFSNKIVETKEVKTKFLYVGLVIGMFFLPIWQIFQINNEFSLHGVYIENYHGDYFQHYIIGFLIGSFKSFYYTIIPSVVIFTIVGCLFKKYKRVRTK